MRDETATDNAAARPAAPIVAIGAAAGAVDALRTLLGGMPIDTGAAFIVVVDRPDSPASPLPELLKAYTALPIRDAGDSIPLEANAIVVVASTHRLAAVGTQLRLVPARPDQSGPVDALLRSVAAAHGDRAIGIVLTGAGSDGTLGLGQIKGYGGLTIAQQPSEAEAAGMPRSAIDAGVVDLALPLRDMPAAIARYCRAAPRLSTATDSGESAVVALLAVLDERASRTLGSLAPQLLIQRAGRRMRMHAIEDWSEYLRLLRADKAEAGALVKDVLHNVAEFFESPFERLETEVLPQLFELKHGDQDSLRAWIVGCSTGETAYSLAIALLEQSAQRAVRPRIQIFASDFDHNSLQRARLGRYPAAIAGLMSSSRLAKCFAREDGSYRVQPALRNLVVFAAHDVVNDFPFSQLDLVLCRRALLEHLKPDVRRAVLRNFHYSLRPHGILVVDSDGADVAEAPLFSSAGGGIYRRMPAERHVPAPPSGAWPRPQGDARHRSELQLPDARVLHLALLERYAPASVLVDAAGTVLHYSARAGLYLRLPGGELTHELVNLVREPLRSAVRAGLDAVDRNATSWASDSLLVHAHNGVRRVAVHIDSPGGGFPAANIKLVVFEELGSGDAIRQGQPRLATADFTRRLSSELDEASQRLNAVVESVLPEPHRFDAELRRTLDDLESAKEELRSINEELMTLDQDNRARLEELARLSADLEVLLESTGLATLFLDRDLRIVRFTPPLLELFYIEPSDKGRPLAELEHRLRNEDLLADVRRVLKHESPLEREVEADTGKWYLLRMLPYRSAPHGLGGVALTLVDITSRKKAELELREADRRKDEFIALLAHELRNPLAPISSGIEILKRRDLDPAIAERVTLTMSRQAGQLVRLIDDLLDVSRITSGRLQLRRKPVVLADVVRDAVAAVRPFMERSGHELVVDTPRERILLHADAARLTQVLANLLNNAARYTPNSGKIELRAQHADGKAVVTVKDNGYGIAPDVLPHVFEMFYQGTDPRAQQSGLGIGLALAKSLVAMHGGTIEVASEGIDRGSTFTLELPEIEPLADEARAESRGTESASLGGHRVLVVDDNADAAKTLAVLLQTLGENDVHVAFSGEEALPLAERLKPDTVFLDLKMPNMDGYEVAERLRSEPWGKDAWLVALTGWGLNEHKRRTKDVGFDEHLTKPADRAALEAILRRPPPSKTTNGGAALRH